MRSSLHTDGYFTDRKLTKVANSIKPILWILFLLAFIALVVFCVQTALAITVQTFDSIPTTQSKVAIATAVSFGTVIISSTKGLLY